MRTLKSLLLLVIIAGISVSSFSQNKTKFGHINSQKLLELMPEQASAVKELEAYAAELEETLAMMQKEFEQKYTEYTAKVDSLSDFLRKNKEEELQMMNQRIEAFRGQAGQDVQAKNAILSEPIIKKAKDAIQSVAKEQGLIYVFDIAEGTGGLVVLYHSEDSKDILPLVKKKLNIQ